MGSLQGSKSIHQPILGFLCRNSSSISTALPLAFNRPCRKGVSALVSVPLSRILFNFLSWARGLTLKEKLLYGGFLARIPATKTMSASHT